MKTGKRRGMAFFLALVMILTSAIGIMPEQAHAATKTMAHLKAGSGNGNGHFGGEKPEAFILSDKADIRDEALSATVMIESPGGETRFRFVTKYISDTEWAFIMYDTGKWNWQRGSNSYGLINGLPEMNQGDMVNIRTEYQTDGLKITVENITTGISGEAVVSQLGAEALKAEGKIGFGAATFGIAYTEFYFADVQAGDHAWSSYDNWTLYSEGGQVWEPAVEVEIGGEDPDPDPDPDPGESQEGRKWITINSGSNGGGGHSYGNSGVKAPALLLDQSRNTAQAGTLSLTVKPGNDNWGVFYTYKDDNNWLYVGYDPSSQWYFQYKINGSESYPKISGLPTPVIGEELQMSIATDRETLSVTVDGVNKKVTNQALLNLSDATAGGRFGVKVNNSNTTISFADMKYNGQDCMGDEWAFAADRGHSFTEEYAAVRTVSGTITNEADEPVKEATVRFGVKSAVTDENGLYQIAGVEVGTYNMAVTKLGYQPYLNEVEVTEEGENVFDASLLAKEPLDLENYDTIASSDMTVYIGKEFPVAARYVMKDCDPEKDFFRGNEEELKEVQINGTAIEPEVEVSETTDDSRTYAMHLEDAEAKINLDMDVKISVKETDLTWEVVKLEKAEGCAKIKTIDIPQLNLLTVDAIEEGANFAGAKKSTTTTVSGDVYIDFEESFVPSETDKYLYAFLSNGKYSAGLHSNSEAEGDLRVRRNNGAETISLSSAAWYYEAGDAGGQSYGADYPVSELPCAKVAIGADENKDGDIDWNDGAIAFRDVMHMAYETDVIKDMVNYRIVMNFASMAPNPYLATADNIKKVYLATDGLPQAVMLKGYGNEGHDSANSEYADIAEREGGVEDFKELIQIAHDYNTEVGIHVNAQEAYPESKSFNDNMITSRTSHGWGWLDQSIVIDKLWDLSSQARYKRFVQLFDRINDTDLLSLDWDKGEYVIDSQGTLASPEAIAAAVEAAGEDNMDFIYLDVWYQNSWETRRIAEEINSLGWRFSTEFSDQGEYDSTWQHWATDATYGGAGMKGFNSDIIRFLRNDQRDSQVLNYPEFGGTADNPLLGGYRLYGFEGWGGDQDFNSYIKETFNQNLPTKFLQHYIVTDWENYEEGESPVGNHEKQITLKSDPADENADIVVVTRKEEQRGDSNIERIITLNGKTVLDDVTYLLPWTDNQDDSEKLYHWNLEGGTTTWELPDGWDSAIMYELTDQGRGEGIPVGAGGTVTIDAKAATPYVLVKGASSKTLKADFGESDYVVDPGFNGYPGAGEQLSSDEWSGDIQNPAVVVEKANTGDQRMAINSPAVDVAVTTQISGLKAGVDYVAEVNIQNDSNEKAYLKVNTGSGEVSEYTERSIAQNYIQCDTKHRNSQDPYKMQRMQISFTAEGSTADLTLCREAGEGSTYIDDIRIVEKKLYNYKEDGSFEQDFETVVQGIYPFVMGPAQGVTDPRTHLSQRNGEYTQMGFGGEKNSIYAKPIDDVIDGEWSLKHHQISTGIIYQTIPQNFRFEPGKVYTVEFDYQSAMDKVYAMVIGDAENYYLPAESDYLAQARGEDETTHVEMQVIGSGSGQTWIGLYGNGSKLNQTIPDLDGDQKLDLETNLGYQDFVLDNLKITEDKDAVAATISGTELYVGETADIYGSGLEKITWTSSDETVAVADPEALKIKALKAGTAVLTATANGETIAEFTITVTDSVVTEIPAEEMPNLSSEANTEQVSGEPAGSGVAGAATDGNSGTYWHSQWNGFNVSESTPAVLTVTLDPATEIGGFKFQQRPDTNNGIVQQYGYTIYDADGNVLEQKDGIEVSAAERSGGAWITTTLEQTYLAAKIDISVTQGQGGFAAIAEVQPIRVEKVATGIEMETEIELDLNDTFTFEPIPTGGTMLKGLVWSSSDEAVATVNQNGVVTPHAAGDAIITVENAAGLKAECTVKVTGEVIVDKPEPPEEVKEESVTSDSITVSWTASEGAEAYIVVVDGNEYKTETTKITIDGLKAETEYEIIVYAVNQEGKSEAASFKATTAKADEPGEDKESPTKPEGLKATDVQKDSVKIQWKASKDNVGVKGYAIYLNGEKIGSVDGKTTSALISNLKEGTEYEIGVVAYDEAGNYSDTATVKVTTKGKEPAGGSGTGTGDTKPTVTPAKTGDSAPILFLLAVILAAGGTVVVIMKRQAAAKRVKRRRRR